MRRPPQGPAERATRQRDAIKAVIRAAKRPLSPQEILDGARAAVRALGMATVYRNLKRLVAEGAVQVITLPGEIPRYEMTEVGAPPPLPVHDLSSRLRRSRVPGEPASSGTPRFPVEHHDVTLYGRCSDCGKREARAAR